MKLPGRKSEHEKQRELMDEQTRQDRHNQNLGVAGEQDGLGAEAYLELAESELDSDTVDLVKQYLVRDWLSGNIKDAEHHELRWLREIYLLMLEAVHPSENTAMKGEKRRLVYSQNGQRDTKVRELQPLDGYDKIIIENILDAALFKSSLSRDAEFWNQLAKSYSVSEVREEERTGGDGWLSFG